MAGMNMLRSRLGGMKITLSKFAEEMGMSRPTARKKIDGKAQFDAKEIQKACEILQIPINEVPLYFFAESVAKMSTKLD